MQGPSSKEATLLHMSQKATERRRESENQGAFIHPEPSARESWSVERIPEPGPRNLVLLQLLAPLGWPPSLTSPGLGSCLFQVEHTDPAGHVQRLRPAKLTRDGSTFCSQKTRPPGQQLGRLLGCPSWARAPLTSPCGSRGHRGRGYRLLFQAVTGWKMERAGNT